MQGSGKNETGKGNGKVAEGRRPVTELVIEDMDDRSGTPTGPDSFGYVYFNDGSRVGYSPGADGEDVWQPRTNGGGRHVEVTPRHLEMARAYLREAGVLS